MNKDDEKDILRIKATMKVCELDLIDEQIKIYESNIEAMRDDELYEDFYKGKEYSIAPNQTQRFRQIAFSELMANAWKSIKEKVIAFEEMKK